MDILINHCWCADSNWGGVYSCSSIVTINRISKGKTYYDPPTVDWINLLDQCQLDDGARVPRLKSEVVAWLLTNIKDREETPTKGWCMGSDIYNRNATISFNLFFERPKDALRFVKQWSCYRNPEDYLNYFRDIRRRLDYTTGCLRRVQR